MMLLQLQEKCLFLFLWLYNVVRSSQLLNKTSVILLRLIGKIDVLNFIKIINLTISQSKLIFVKQKSNQIASRTQKRSIHPISWKLQISRETSYFHRVTCSRNWDKDQKTVNSLNFMQKINFIFYPHFHP